MKILNIPLSMTMILTVFLTLISCSRDNELENYIEKSTRLIDSVVAAIDADPSAKGVEKAQAVFDAGQVEVKQSIAILNRLPPSQVSEEMSKKVIKCTAENGNKLWQVLERHARVAKTDKEFLPKMDKLFDGYALMLK